MRLKDLFTVPTGQKITDKYLQRVLIVSICGILLSMSCLAGTTWAWYVVDIQNVENEINIGKPEINVTVNGTNVEDGIELGAGSHSVDLVHANEADDLNSRSTLYVTLTFQYGGKVVTKYTKLDSANHARQIHVNNESGENCQLTWGVSWLMPQGTIAEELTDLGIELEPLNAPEGIDDDGEQEETTETTEATTVPTEPSEETPADDEQTDEDSGEDTENTDSEETDDVPGEDTENTNNEDTEDSTEEDHEESNGDDSENADS